MQDHQFILLSPRVVAYSSTYNSKLLHHSMYVRPDPKPHRYTLYARQYVWMRAALPALPQTWRLQTVLCWTLNRHAGFAQGNRAPRGALVTYIHTWRAFAKLHPGVDFLLSTFESWRRSVGHFPGRKLDLVAVTTGAVAEKLHQHATIGHLCQVQTLSSAGLVGATHGDSMRVQMSSQCWLLTHTSAQVREWEGFPMVHDILHVASDKFKQFAHGMQYNNIVVVRSL